MTVGRLGRESEGLIVAMKPGNSGGAKGPCRERVSARRKENRLDQPTTEHGPPNPDQPPAEPEVKSGVTLPVTENGRKGKDIAALP